MSEKTYIKYQTNADNGPVGFNEFAHAFLKENTTKDPKNFTDLNFNVYKQGKFWTAVCRELNIFGNGGTFQEAMGDLMSKLKT